MTLLALDTSGPLCATALADCETGQILACQRPAIERGHAEVLLIQIQEMMRDAQIAFDDISCLAITLGPGSFAGLRVAMSAAKGFAVAHNIPLVGINNFDVYRAQLSMQIGSKLASEAFLALDGRRGEIFYQSHLGEIGRFAMQNAQHDCPVLDETRLIAGPMAQGLSELLPQHKGEFIEMGASPDIDALVELSLKADKATSTISTPPYSSFDSKGMP